MKRLITITILLWANCLFSQDYFSYSFSGTPIIEHLEAKILSIEGIKACKIRLKEDQNTGEIVFELQAYKKSEDLKNPDPLIQIKKIITDFGLTPIELMQINY